MCANCFFFREGDTPFTGRCLHPAQQLPLDPQPLVRGRELRCRDSWDHHNWIPKQFEATDRIIHVRIARTPQPPAARTPQPTPVRARYCSTEVQVPLEITIDESTLAATEAHRPFRIADDIALSLMGHAPLTPPQERHCGNCRCFVASANGLTGLCTNLLVSTTFHHVAASGLACESLLGCWWQAQEPAAIAFADAIHPVDTPARTNPVYPLSDA